MLIVKNLSYTDLWKFGFDALQARVETRSDFFTYKIWIWFKIFGLDYQKTFYSSKLKKKLLKVLNHLIII